jgi:hypothetical protein
MQHGPSGLEIRARLINAMSVIVARLMIFGAPLGWAECPPDGTIRSVRNSSHSDRMGKMSAICFWRRVSQPSRFTRVLNISTFAADAGMVYV